MQIIGSDGKEYNSVEECRKADEAFEKAKKKAEEEAAEKKALISKQKKEKADSIKAAESDVEIARTEYNRAQAKARDMVAEAKEEAKKLVEEAGKVYRDALDKRYQAIVDFSKEFGTYTTTYTGKEALDEYNRIVDSFNSVWNRLLNWF